MLGKVLITGGLGNLGSWITKEFCDNGYEVYILTRKVKNVIKEISYKIIEADITCLETLRQKLDIDFDYCIHTASLNEYFLDDYPKKALEINTLGTRNLLEILSNKNLKRFVYFSTFHVYGITEGTINEFSELDCKNDYASTHLFAEYYVKQFYATRGLKYTIFRLTNSYGCPLFSDTDKWYLIFNDLVKSAYDNQEIILKSNGHIQKDFIWMGDVARISRKILQVNDNGICNLSRAKSLTLLELASLVKQEYEKRYKRKVCISINEKDKTRYADLLVDNKSLKNALNDVKLTDNFSNEIQNTFNLLEGKK